jgi:hypothetical protein
MVHASHTDMASEPRIGSYRAEGYDAKAGALFLWNIFQNSKCTIPDTPDAGFDYHCENQGLLKKLAEFCKYKNAGQATCLHSEWDIVSSIHLLSMASLSYSC